MDRNALVKAQGEVPAASEELDKSLEELESSINALTARLISVLRQEPTEESPGTERTSAACELAERTTQQIVRLGACVNRLASIQGRLEL